MTTAFKFKTPAGCLSGVCVWYLTNTSEKDRGSLTPGLFNQKTTYIIKNGQGQTSLAVLVSRYVKRLAVQIIHQPLHRWTLLTIALDQASTFTPGCTHNITPEGNADYVGMVVEDREVHLHVLQLSLIIGCFNVILGNVQREAQSGNLIKFGLDFLSGPHTWGVQAVRLKTQSVHVTRIHSRANHIDDGIGIPGHEVIVVVNQDRVRAVLTCQTEGLSNPVAAKCISRVVGRCVRRQSFVYDVDHRGIRITCTVIANPLFNFLALLSRTQSINPARTLTAPYQGVSLDRNTIRAGEVIDGIQRTPVILVAVSFN